MILKLRALASCLVFANMVSFALAADPVQSSAPDSQKARAEKEGKLIRVLRSDGAPEDKALACKQLAVCGTKDAVPSLAALLSDEWLASWARIALEAIPSPTADAALRKAMSKLHGKLLVGTINSIGVRRDAKATRGLVKRLKDANTDVAGAAAAALGRIGGVKAAKALEPLLASAPPAVRPAIAEGCILCAEGFLAEKQFATAVSLYDTVRKANVSKQQNLEATRGAILARQSAGLDLLVEQLRSPDPALFGIGLRTARELPGREVTDALAAEMGRCTPERQAYVLLAVADRDDASVFPVILKAAQSGPPEVRIVAVGILDRLGRSDSVPVLLDAAVSSDKNLAQAALGALVRLPGKEVDSDLLARLPHSAGRSREILIDLASQRRIDGALLPILVFAEDGDAAARSAAVQAIGILGNDKQTAILARLAGKAQTPKERADCEMALIAIAGRAGTACLPDLLTLARNDDSAVRIIGLHVLASAGGREALAAVRAALEDKDEAVQDEAVRTLSTWPNNWPEDSAVAEPLLTLAKSAGKSSYQVLGLRGYLQYVQGDKQLKNDEKVALVKEVLPLAKRPEEQRLAVAVVGAIPTAKALDLLVTLASEPAIVEEACSAILAMQSKNLKEVPKELRRKALETVAERSKNGPTKAKAQEMLDKTR
jgi:HEAT repeat protein